MLSFKFKFLALIFLFPFHLLASEACLTSHYETTVSHKGQPFGLTETKLMISKKGCVIEISHEKMRFIKKNWLVDVCRSPVHIKTGAGAVTVMRRQMDCLNENAALDPFCLEIGDMKRMMEDDGLIFAQGDKDNLNDPHGKVTCAVHLIQRYLHDGHVLSVSDFKAAPPSFESTPVILEMETDLEVETVQ